MSRLARRRLRCCGHRSKGHDNKLLPNFESCEPRSRELGSAAAKTSSTEKQASTRSAAEFTYGYGYLSIRCKCTTFLSVSDKNERKYVSCRTYSVRMCFEVVVFCLCAVRKQRKLRRACGRTGRRADELSADGGQMTNAQKRMGCNTEKTECCG